MPVFVFSGGCAAIISPGRLIMAVVAMFQVALTTSIPILGIWV